MIEIKTNVDNGDKRISKKSMLGLLNYVFNKDHCQRVMNALAVSSSFLKVRPNSVFLKSYARQSSLPIMLQKCAVCTDQFAEPLLLLQCFSTSVAEVGCILLSS